MLQPLGPGHHLLGPEDEMDCRESFQDSFPPGEPVDQDRKDAGRQTQKKEGVRKKCESHKQFQRKE